MSIFVDASDNILTLQLFDEKGPAYERLAEIFHKPGSGVHWHKLTKRWRVKPAVWDRLFEQLENLTLITVTPGADAFIESSRSMPDRIEELDSGFNLRELVKPPLKGKVPNEDFQIEDLYRLITHNRLGLYNEQGTGKSWELITMANLRYERGESKKIVFYTSNSGVYNMVLEFGKFSRIPRERIAVASTENRRPFDDPNVHVVITNYGTMRMVEDGYRLTRTGTEGPRSKFTRVFQKWLAGDPGTLICDEAQAISNPEAQQSQIVDCINEMVYYAYPATGTPADKEQKWYAQLRFLDRKLVKGLSWKEWAAEFFYIGTKHSSAAIGDIRPEKKVELQALVAQYCIRRFANDVLELPPHLMRDVYVPMTYKQRWIYQHIVINKMQMLQTDDQGLLSAKVVQSFPYLISALDDPEILLRHEDRIADEELVQRVQEFDFSQDHSKLDALFDILEKHSGGEKIIIWNSHPSVAKKLAKILKRWKPIVLNGESKPPKGMSLDEFKMKIVQEFQESSTQNLMILGMQVMNSSVNIVKANVQIVYDTNYNYVEFDQMMKRVHRNGQARTVYTYFLVIDKSLDVARRMNLKEKDWVNKMFLTEQYLSGENAKKLFNLSVEDINEENSDSDESVDPDLVY